MTMADRPDPTTRARHSFWLLVLIAALAAGGLSTTLVAHPGPATGAGVALSGLVLVVSLTLATRVLLALDRARHTSKMSRRR